MSRISLHEIVQVCFYMFWLWLVPFLYWETVPTSLIMYVTFSLSHVSRGQSSKMCFYTERCMEIPVKLIIIIIIPFMYSLLFIEHFSQCSNNLYTGEESKKSLYALYNTLKAREHIKCTLSSRACPPLASELLNSDDVWRSYILSKYILFSSKWLFCLVAKMFNSVAR